MTGMEQLGAWLAEDHIIHYVSFFGWVSVGIQFRCILSRKYKGDGPTPDAAAKAAVEAARKASQ